MKKVISFIICASLMFCLAMTPAFAAEAESVNAAMGNFAAQEELITFMDPYIGNVGVDYITSEQAHHIVDLGYAISEGKMFNPERPVFELYKGVWFASYMGEDDISAIVIYGYCPDGYDAETGMYRLFCYELAVGEMHVW